MRSRAQTDAASIVFPLAIVLITALAAVLRFWALDLGLPHLQTRPDESPVIQLTAQVARGEPRLGWNIYPDAYVYLTWLWGEAGVRGGAGLGLLPTASYLEVLRDTPEHVYLLARGLSAFAGTLAVPLLMLCLRRGVGVAPAIVSGLLLATNFLHARDSHAAKPDALLSLWVVAILLATLPLAKRATTKRGALAGLALGAATATKYPGILLAFPIYVAAVLGSDRRGWRRIVPTPALAAGGVAAAFFVLTSPFLVFGEEFVGWVLGTLKLLFPGVGSAIDAGSVPLILSPDGPSRSPFAPSTWWGGWSYHARFSLRYGAGLLVTLLAPLAVGWGLVSRRPVGRIAAAYAIFYYAIVGLSPALLARYMTVLIPPLALLEAQLIWDATRILAGRARTIVLSLVTVCLIAEPLASSVQHNLIAAHIDTRVMASRWVEEHVPEGSAVAILGTRFWSWGAPKLPRSVTRVPVHEDSDVLVAKRVDYVVIHDHPLFSSTLDREVWAELEPRAELLVEFDPFLEPGGAAVFEAADAYYIPYAGFHAVERPGPVIHVYRLRIADDRGSGADGRSG